MIGAALAAALAGFTLGPVAIDIAASSDARSEIPVLGAIGVRAAHEKYDTIASVAIGVVAFVILRRL